ncbi:MAG: VTT domain-containing protein [Acidobacteriota bacterium]
MDHAWVLASIALATLVSEDAAAVGAGALAATGGVPPVGAAAAAGVGIYAGDIGLYVLGRLARRTGPFERLVARRWPAATNDAARRKVERAVAPVVLVTRFTPGTRTITYVAAGLCGVRAVPFLFWTAVAVSLWTSLIVGGVWLLGS